MSETHRSLCPINLGLEVFGDRWTLLIIRDLMFAGKRHFRELLHSDERIASNILADRLTMLVEQGIVTRSGDPSHKQKAVYSLTEKGISLLPVLAQIGIWSRRYLPVSEELGATAAELEAGGPALWEQRMSELRALHMGDDRQSRQEPGFKGEDDEDWRRHHR
jgi:DNA-binding HxlR family transcriptional regulator